MEKYGFVYIWYDRKRKMYYIGSHYGTEKPWVKGQVGRRDSEETREKKRIAALIREQQKREMCDLNIRNKN